MSEATLTVRQARALANFAPKLDIRYYLNGVLFDFEKGRAVVTDGHKLVALNLGAVTHNTGSDSCIVPRQALLDAAKGGSRDDEITVVCDDAAGIKVRVIRGKTETTIEGVNGRYPCYERVLPEKISGEPGQYNWQYLAETQKCLSEIISDAGKGTAQFHYNGDIAGVMTIFGYEDEAIGIIMPMRPGKGFQATQNWCPEFLKPTKAKAA